MVGVGVGVTFLLNNLFLNHQDLIDVFFHNKLARLVFVLIIIFFIHDIYLKKRKRQSPKKKKKLTPPSRHPSLVACLHLYDSSHKHK